MNTTFCSKCGAGDQVAGTMCTACGNTLPADPSIPPVASSYVPTSPPAAASAGPAHAKLGDDAAIRMILPVGRSVWAIVAGYLGLLSIAGGITSIPAIICGIVAIRDIQRHPDRHGMGRAVFGIVMGVIGLGIMAWFLLTIAFAK